MPRPPRAPAPAYPTPGTEPNRTDLAAKRVQPLTAPAGRQPYGAKKAEIDYQRAAPMGAEAGGGGFDSQIETLRAAPPPRVTPLTAPTQRPVEPLTAGLAGGPGPGPEVLSMPAKRTRVADVFATLADQYGDKGWGELALAARRLGQ